MTGAMDSSFAKTYRTTRAVWIVGVALRLVVLSIGLLVTLMAAASDSGGSLWIGWMFFVAFVVGIRETTGWMWVDVKGITVRNVAFRYCIPWAWIDGFERGTQLELRVRGSGNVKVRAIQQVTIARWLGAKSTVDAVADELEEFAASRAVLRDGGAVVVREWAPLTAWEIVQVVMGFLAFSVASLPVFV